MAMAPGFGTFQGVLITVVVVIIALIIYDALLRGKFNAAQAA